MTSSDASPDIFSITDWIKHHYYYCLWLVMWYLDFPETLWGILLTSNGNKTPINHQVLFLKIHRKFEFKRKFAHYVLQNFSHKPSLCKTYNVSTQMMFIWAKSPTSIIWVKGWGYWFTCYHCDHSSLSKQKKKTEIPTSFISIMWCISKWKWFSPVDVVKYNIKTLASSLIRHLYHSTVWLSLHALLFFHPNNYMQWITPSVNICF